MLDRQWSHTRGGTLALGQYLIQLAALRRTRGTLLNSEEADFGENEPTQKRTSTPGRMYIRVTHALIIVVIIGRSRSRSLFRERSKSFSRGPGPWMSSALQSVTLDTFNEENGGRFRLCLWRER